MTQSDMVGAVVSYLIALMDAGEAGAVGALPMQLASLVVLVMAPVHALLLFLHGQVCALEAGFGLEGEAGDRVGAGERMGGIDSGFSTPLPVATKADAPTGNPASPTPVSTPAPIPKPVGDREDGEATEGGGDGGSFLIYAGVRSITLDTPAAPAGVPGILELIGEMHQRVEEAHASPVGILEERDATLLMIVLARTFATSPLNALYQLLESLVQEAKYEQMGGVGDQILALRTLALAMYAGSCLDLGLGVDHIYVAEWPAFSPLKQCLEGISHARIAAESDASAVMARQLALRAGAEIASRCGDAGAARWYERQASADGCTTTAPLLPTDILLALTALEGEKGDTPAALVEGRARAMRAARLLVEMEGVTALPSPLLAVYALSRMG